MLKSILITVLVGIAALLLFAASKQGTFRVERQISIAAPSEKIHPLISDFHNWPAWSPWEKKDPAMKRTHSGPASGVGAVYAWEGNQEVGAGSMTITGSTAPNKVLIQLDFSKPFTAHNIAEFTLTAKGGGTEVSWAMHGPMPYLSKVISVFVSMDSMIGKDFEAGLANLKTVAEK